MSKIVKTVKTVQNCKKKIVKNGLKQSTLVYNGQQHSKTAKNGFKKLKETVKYSNKIWSKIIQMVKMVKNNKKRAKKTWKKGFKKIYSQKW